MKLETLSQIVLAALLFLAGNSYVRLTSAVDDLALRVYGHDVQIAELRAKR